MYGCEKTAYAYCGDGIKIRLADHLKNVASVISGIPRLTAPIQVVGKVLHRMSGINEEIAPSATISAALLHDLGKGCSKFVLKCEKYGETSFFGHEIVSTYYVLKAYENCWGKCGEISDTELSTLYALIAYGVIAHHHAMSGRGLEALHTNFNQKVSCGRVLSLNDVELALNGIKNELRYIDAEFIKFIELSVKATLAEVRNETNPPQNLVKEIREMIKDLYKDRYEADEVMKAVFSPNPPMNKFGYLVRRAAFTVAGVLSAADTIAANVEGRPHKSVFFQRLSRELRIDDLFRV